MKKLVVVLISTSLTMLLVVGVALAVEKRCKTTADDNRCYGTRQADTLLGTQRAEYFDSFGGPDTARASAGNDTVYGGTGDDDLFANEGDDRVYPESGNDTTYGGKGSDRYVFYGRWGRDVIVDARPAQQGCPRCPFNVIEFPYAPTAPIIVNLDSSPARSEVRTSDATQTINWSDDVITGIGNTGAGDDIIRGNERANSIGSNRGDDAVYGAAGNDRIVVADGVGGDTVDCGEGNDTVYSDPDDTVRNCEDTRDLQGNPV